MHRSLDKQKLCLSYLGIDSIEELSEKGLEVVIGWHNIIWELLDFLKVGLDTLESWVLRGGHAKVDFLDNAKIFIEP
jgi:hypothetical protein